jgi:hypothetical protein
VEILIENLIGVYQRSSVVKKSTGKGFIFKKFSPDFTHSSGSSE